MHWIKMSCNSGTHMVFTEQNATETSGVKRLAIMFGVIDSALHWNGCTIFLCNKLIWSTKNNIDYIKYGGKMTKWVHYTDFRYLKIWMGLKQNSDIINGIEVLLFCVVGSSSGSGLIESKVLHTSLSGLWINQMSKMTYAHFCHKFLMYSYAWFYLSMCFYEN